jgi:hypothetical protein
VLAEDHVQAMDGDGQFGKGTDGVRREGVRFAATVGSIKALAEWSRVVEIARPFQKFFDERDAPLSGADGFEGGRWFKAIGGDGFEQGTLEVATAGGPVAIDATCQIGAKGDARLGKGGLGTGAANGQPKVTQVCGILPGLQFHVAEEDTVAT